MIAIDDNFKISENGGTGNATIFVSATDKNLFSTASTQVEVSTSVGGNIKRYVTLNKKAAHGYMYTPVEWVSNENLNSDCWIDLGYVWNNNSRAQFKGAYGTSEGNEWFGERITNWTSNGPVDDNGDLRWMYNNSTQRLMWDVPSGKRVEKTSYTPSTPFELEIGNFYIKNLQTGSNLVTGSTYNVSRTNTVGLFSASGARGVIDKIKFYYIKIYEGNTLIMDIIPVLDKDNIPCFFDKVGEQFYYYKVNGVPSTGLTAGNVAYYTSDYIEGDGSDYIDIGYIPVANTYIEMDNQTDSMLTCGSYDDRSYGLYWQREDDTSGYWRYSSDVKQIFFTSLPSTRYTVKFGKQYYINGEQKDSTSRSWVDKSISVTVFGLHRPSDVTERTAGKLYGLKIYEGDTLVREYIPYKQYGVVGLYEKINGIFYPSNSNTMTQGGNIQPVVEKVVYSESDIIISNDTPSTAISTTFNLNASTTPTGATLTYSSSDTSIATVDSNGVITAVAKGTATITITAQAFQDNTNHIYYNTTSKTVSVECAYPTQQIVITNSTPSEAINPNDTFDLNASTTPTGITLTYSSSDTSVATVNSNGVITGVATGTTTITITAQGFDDDVNKVHYNTTSKTVTVEVQEATPTPAWDDDFLTIEALNAETTIQLKNPSNKNIWYRKDNQTEYTKIPTRDTSITIENANGYIKLYGDNEGVGTNSNATAFNIYCQMNCNCYGKVTSLLSSGCPETISSTYTFSRLFRQSLIVDASGLILPNNVTANCYYQMFYACTSLTQAPQLPATSLAEGCYYQMFYACSNLSTVTLYYIDSAPTTGQGYFYKWLQNAGGTGSTIYAPADALWDSSDSKMYIPSNWTVEKTL